MSENRNNLTGYPSIDKPWLKYYTNEQIEIDLPTCKAYEYMYRQNKDNPDRIAIDYFDRKITYGQMFKEVELAAKAFCHIGIHAGDIVAVIAVALPETVYTFYGLNRIGAISNMIDPRTSIEGIREYISEVKARVVVIMDIAFDRVYKAVGGTTVENIIVISPSDSLPFLKKTLYRLSNRKHCNKAEYIRWIEFINNGKNQKIDDTPYKKDECCVIVHTGGTTGVPKGVMLSNDNINAAAQQILFSPLPLCAGDVFLNIMPPFIAYGTVLGIHTVSVGSLCSVLIPQFNPDQFDKLILKYKPQCLMGVPTHFEGIIRSRKLAAVDFSFLKVAFVGGDKIKEEAETRINRFFEEHNCKIKISKGYSLTEASATATFASNICNKIGSAGSPLAKTTIACFGDSLDDEKKCGETGDVYISSPTIMMGYYGKEEETAEIIRTGSDGKRWLFTGDLGYLDEDGQLFVEGRIKRMIVRHDGFKIFPALVENIIESDSRIETCCVVGKDDPVYAQGKLPVVYAVLCEDTHDSIEMIINDLRLRCRDKLPEYAQPVKIEIIERIPLTSIGKVDYRTLEKRAEDE